jgi:hypothetical protein
MGIGARNRSYLSRGVNLTVPTASNLLETLKRTRWTCPGLVDG